MRLHPFKFLRVAEDLREIDYGELSHKKKSWVRENTSNYKRDWNHVFKNGESFNQAKKRVFSFLSNLSYEDYDNVLIVTHAGIIRSLMTPDSKKYPDPLSLSLDHNTIYTLNVEKGILKDFKELF